MIDRMNFKLEVKGGERDTERELRKERGSDGLKDSELFFGLIV